MSQSIVTVISGENQIDVSDAPALCDPLVEQGVIESWRLAPEVQGVALILKPGTTSLQREMLLAFIHQKGLDTIEG